MRSSLCVLALATGCLAGTSSSPSLALAPREAILTVLSTAPTRRASSLCFIVGNTALPAETQDSADALANVISCSRTQTTIATVPDVTAGDVSFSDINFEDSSDSTLAFALSEFATSSPLAANDLATFQNELDVYLATEAGIRSLGSGQSLAIKVPKFFLAFQVSRIQTAQGNPPADPGQTVEHLLGKVLTNAAGQGQDLLDQVTALSKVLA